MQCPVCLEKDETVKHRSEFSSDMCDLCYDETTIKREIENEEFEESIK